MILAGGGLKIIKSLGGLLYMEKHGYLNCIQKYYGTSSGALCAMLLALGYNVNQIIDAFSQLVHDKLFDINLDIDILFERYAIYNTEKFDRLLKSLIGCKLCPSNPSLYKDITALEMYNITKKTLTVSTTNLSTGKVVYMNHLNYPDITVYNMVKMSCAIPIFFEPIEYKGELYADGALLDNFPLNAVPKNELHLTTGLFIDTVTEYCEMPFGNLTNYLTRITNITLTNLSGTSADNIFNITIDDSLNKNIIDAKLTDEKKRDMIREGYNEIKQLVKLKAPKRRNSFTI